MEHDSKTGVTLSAGQQVWRLAMDSNGTTTAVGNFNYLRAISATSSPYGGVAAALPGTLQAENFDEGGAGISFADTTPENSGGSIARPPSISRRHRIRDPATTLVGSSRVSGSSTRSMSRWQVPTIWNFAWPPLVRAASSTSK